eukprot:9478831-Pyramimonas_sp.AAC.1
MAADALNYFSANNLETFFSESRAFPYPVIQSASAPAAQRALLRVLIILPAGMHAGPEGPRRHRTKSPLFQR